MNTRIIGFAAMLAALAIPAYSASADHLVISEVAPRGGLWINAAESPEFTEIYNPTGAAINLGNYYITDWSQYWRYPDYVRTGTLPNEGTGDFVQQFPGDEIGPGKVVVATANAKQFLLSYFNPTAEVDPDLTVLLAAFTSQPGNPVLYEATDSMPEVPNLINLNGDTSSNSTNQSHTDAGENIFLFYYDGTSDTVKDVDMVFYKKRGATLGLDNGIFPKNEAVDGPDVDEVATAYLTDNGSEDNLAVQYADTSPFGLTRVSLFEAGETGTGGNGLTGHDETTEEIRATFVASTPTTASTPGVPDPELTAADKKPVISNSVSTPKIPNSTSAFTLSADIHDDGSIVSATVYATANSTTVTYPMTQGSGDNWSVTIPAGTYPNHTVVTWYVEATDNTGNTVNQLAYADFGNTGDQAMNTFGINDSPIEGLVVINEIMFDPNGGDNSGNPEYLELYNQGSTALDLDGYNYQFGANAVFTFPSGTTIGAHDYLVLVTNVSLFTSKYPSVPADKVIGVGTFNMPNSGTGVVNLRSWDGVTVVDTVSYRVTPPWPGNTVSGSNYAASNTGYSIELLDPTLDNDDGANWIVSSQAGTAPAGGTPGMNNFSIDCVRDIVSPTPADPITITARVAGTHAASNVELTYSVNGADTQTVAMTNVPSTNNFTYTIPAQADRSFINYNVTATDAVDSVSITANPKDYTFLVKSEAMITEDDIVINEILQDPSGGDNSAHSEFIEYYNRRGTSINLGHCLVGPDNANAVEIPEGFTVPAFSYFVLAGNKALFVADYPSVDPDIVIDAGWTASTLAQSGTPIRAMITDPNQVQINRTIYPADFVAYGIPYNAESAPNGWPYGSAKSMSLKEINLDNNTIGNWVMSPNSGTPGAQNTGSSAVSDWSIY